MANNSKINPWDMDVRVRERNLHKGTLDDKDVEKYLSQLPDVGDQADTVVAWSPTSGSCERYFSTSLSSSVPLWRFRSRTRTSMSHGLILLLFAIVLPTSPSSTPVRRRQLSGFPLPSCTC